MIRRHHAQVFDSRGDLRAECNVHAPSLAAAALLALRTLCIVELQAFEAGARSWNLETADGTTVGKLTIDPC